MRIIFKKALSAVSATVMLCTVGLFFTTPAEASPAAYQYIALNNSAIQRDGESWLALRSTFNAMNMKVAWKADGQNKVKLSDGKQTYEMDIVGNALSLGDSTTYPLYIEQGTSYVPLRLFKQIINREVGLSGNQMMVLVDNQPNWQQVGGEWVNQKPLWSELNAYQKPDSPAEDITTETNSDYTAPTPAVAKPAAAAPQDVAVHTGDALIWPTTATYVSSPYGERIYPLGDGVVTDFHTGVDIAGQQGDPIYAAAAGTVTRAEIFYSYGTCVDIQHSSGLVTRYAHLDDINVAVGQAVAQGQVIGTQGMTGAATGPHLHFETRVNDQAVDPDAYIHYR